jgi:hypothetical protein
MASRCPRPLAFALLLALAGCVGMPVSTMLKLRGVDFGTTDLAELAAGLQLPAVLRPQPDSVRLSLTVRPGDGSRIERRFALLPSPVASDRAELERFAAPGMALHAYRLAPDALASLDAFRKEVLTRKAGAASRPQVTLAVAAEACRDGPLADGPVPLTSYLRTGETDGFVVLLGGLDLRDLADAATLDARLPPCPPAAPLIGDARHG